MKRLLPILFGLLIVISLTWVHSHADMHPRTVKIDDPSKPGFTPDQMEWVEMTLAEGHDPLASSR